MIKNTPVEGVGTISVKFSANANLLFGAYIDCGASVDRYGNLAIQWSYAVPGIDDTTSVGFLDIGVCGGVAITDAKDVDGLLGPSSAMGVSGGFLEYWGVDLISFDDMSDMNSELNGFQVSYGKG